MSDYPELYMPSVYKFVSYVDGNVGGLCDVHYIVCQNLEQAVGFANGLFDGSSKSGRCTNPELVADYCFIHPEYLQELEDAK